MTGRDRHLDEEHFSALLAGRPLHATKADPVAAQAALSEEDEAELLAMQAALSTYRNETLQWAEQRSAAQPSLVPAARRSRLWAAAPQWSLAAVAVVTVAAGALHLLNTRAASDETRMEAPAPIATAATTHITPAEIAADNELLSSIDAVLRNRAASPVDEFHLEPAGNRTRGHAAPENMD